MSYNVVPVIKKTALAMSEDDSLLRDTFAYSCYVVCDKAALEIDDELPESDYAVIWTTCNRFVEKAGEAFLRRVIADTKSVLGFDIPQLVKNEILEDLEYDMVAAFVHTLARSYGPLNEEHFVLARKAWLQFLSKYEG